LKIPKYEKKNLVIPFDDMDRFLQFCSKEKLSNLFARHDQYK